MPIDLRSDFVSRPTEAMIEAMVAAAREPPGFGVRDDPVVSRLERLAAEILDKEDALFCPTCTMANQIAIHIHCRPGEVFLTETTAHVITSEAAAAAALSGGMPRLVASVAGHLAVAELEREVSAGDVQRPRTAMILLENTHVRSGGTVVPLEAMQDIHVMAARHDVPVHLDGARIFNAAIALAQPVRVLAQTADTVAFNLNKGLGAPLGAILAGPREAIAAATRIRQMFGGGWRPATIPAAAGIVALRQMINRLADDHANARRLAEGLQGLDGIAVDAKAVETNIVLIDIERDNLDAEALAAALAERDVLALPFGPSRLRCVTHHEITARDVERTIAAFADALIA